MNNPCGLLEVAIMVSIHNDIARWFKSTVECIIVVKDTVIQLVSFPDQYDTMFIA